MFIINENTKLILDNITLSGRINNSGPLVSVLGGAFTMKEGSAITGNDNTGNGGGVRIENAGSSTAAFTMEGGSIHSNTANTGGGVYVTSGTFTMTGGTISGNKSTVSGGGVYVAAGTFTMTGGTISGNTANISDTSGLGGGVYVDSASGGIFTKTGGIIYGFEVPANNKNYVYASGGGPPATGNAVFVQGSLSVRNYTAYETDNLDSTVSGTPGGWD